MEKLQRSRSRYRSPALSARLLDLARTCFHQDPAQARHLSHLAESVSYRAFHLPLQALASAYIANSFRAEGRLGEADREMARAQHLAYLEGVDDFIAAELYSIEASLRADQRRLPEAYGLLRRAGTLYREMELSSGEARCYLQLASCCYCAGNPQEAVDHTRHALRLIDLIEDPRLHLWAHHNLALYLLEAGCAAEARDLLSAVAPLYARADLLPRLRLLWLEGRLALELAEHERAEELLGRSVEGFVAGGFSLFAAMTCLDLGTLHLATGKTEVLSRLAALLPPIFESEGLSRPASAALILFHKAVAHGKVTESVLQTAKEILRQNQGTTSRRLSSNPSF